MRRSIIHADMDAFYASVEQRDDPELRGKPVIVGGSPKSRGVVSAASYEAREFGVHSAMPTSQASRLCPHGIFLPVRMEKYREVSLQIREVFEYYTPLVEPLSLDEAFLDVTGSERLFGPPDVIGREIKARVKAETDLIVSIGVAPNKFLAKLGSGFCKPDGFIQITEEGKLEFLDSLEVRQLWGVGASTARVLHDVGIRTVGQLRKVPAELLEHRIGKAAGFLVQLASGEDDRDVVPDTEAKSIGSECTFPVDISEPETLETVALEHAEDVASRLRASGLKARTVSLKAKLADFTLTTRSETLDEPTDRTDLIGRVSAELLRNHNRLKGRAVRLIGVSVSQLTRCEEQQLSLFEAEEDRKRRKLDKTVDRIREKHGDDSIKRARSMRDEDA